MVHRITTPQNESDKQRTRFMPRPALEIRPLYTRFLFSDVFERKKRRPIDGPRRQSGRMETDQRGPRVNALTSSLHQAAYINVSFKLFLFSSTFTSEIDGHTSAGQNDNCFRLKKSLRDRKKRRRMCPPSTEIFN